MRQMWIKVFVEKNRFSQWNSKYTRGTNFCLTLLQKNWKFSWKHFVSWNSLIVSTYALMYHLKCSWNAVLRASRSKNFKSFPCGAFLWCVADKMFIKVRSYNKPHVPWKIYDCAPVNCQSITIPQYSFLNNGERPCRSLK